MNAEKLKSLSQEALSLEKLIYHYEPLLKRKKWKIEKVDDCILDHEVFTVYQRKHRSQTKLFSYIKSVSFSTTGEPTKFGEIENANPFKGRWEALQIFLYAELLKENIDICY